MIEFFSNSIKTRVFVENRRLVAAVHSLRSIFVAFCIYNFKRVFLKIMQIHFLLLGFQIA